MSVHGPLTVNANPPSPRKYAHDTGGPLRRSLGVANLRRSQARTPDRQREVLLVKENPMPRAMITTPVRVLKYVAIESLRIRRLYHDFPILRQNPGKTLEDASGIRHVFYHVQSQD